MSTQFNCQKHFYFKPLYITIQFSESTVSMTKTVQFQIIQFSISTDFVYTQLHVKKVPCQTIQFSVNTVSMSKNSSISNNSV